jgi:hypothetical protein
VRRSADRRWRDRYLGNLALKFKFGSNSRRIMLGEVAIAGSQSRLAKLLSIRGD